MTNPSRFSPITGAILGIGRLTSAACQSLMLIWLSYRSSAFEAGTTFTWYAIAIVIASVSDLGIGNLTLLSATKSNLVKSRQLFTFGVWSGAIVLVTTCLIAGISGIPPMTLVLVAGLLAWAQLDRLADLGFMFDIANGKIALVGVLTGGRRLLALTIFISIESTLPAGLAFVISLFIASLFSLIFFGKASERVQSINFREASQLLIELKPYLFNSVISQLRVLDAPLITVGAGQARAAGYSLGVRLLSPLMMFYGSSGIAVLGSGTYLDRRKLRNLLLTSSILALGFLVIMVSSEPTYRISLNFVPWLELSDILVICVIGVRSCAWGVAGVISMNLIAQGQIRTAARFNAFFVLGTLVISLVGPMAGFSILETALVSMILALFQVFAFVFKNDSLRKGGPSD